MVHVEGWVDRYLCSAWARGYGSLVSEALLFHRHGHRHFDFVIVAGLVLADLGLAKNESLSLSCRNSDVLHVHVVTATPTIWFPAIFEPYCFPETLLKNY